MNKSLGHLMAVVAFFLILVQLDGQVIPLKKFDIGDGLPTNSIYRTIQDSKGNLWIGTTEGVSKYDGYTFKNFSVRDGVPNNDVFNIIEDLHGRIWLINDRNAIAYIKNDQVVNFDFENAWRISVIGRTNEYTDLYNHEKIFRFFPNDSIQILPKRTILGQASAKNEEFDFFDNQSSLLNGILTRNMRVRELFIFQNKFLGQKNYFKNEMLVISKSDELVKTLQFRNFPYQYNNPYVSFIERDNSELQISSANYMTVYDTLLNPIENYQLPIENITEINSLFRDREGNIWISSLSGLYLAEKRLINESILFNEKSVNLEVSNVFKYNKGKLLVTSNSSLYYVEKDKVELIYKGNERKDSKSFYDVKLYKSDIYFTTRLSGIQKLKRKANNKFELINYQNQILKNSRNVVDKTDRSIKNVITSAKKFNFDRKGFIFLSSRKNFFSYNRESAIVTRLLNQHVDDFALTNSKCYLISEGKVYDFGQDETKQILIDVPNPQGIHILSEETILVHSEVRESYIKGANISRKLDFLSGKKVLKIISEDKSVWILHADGIIAAKLNENYTDLVPLQSYELRSAMNVSTINDVIKNKDIFTIATDNGIFDVNLATWNPTSTELPIYIDSIYTSEQSFLEEEKINLPYDQNSIAIAIKAISLTEMDNVTYHYRLLGAEKEFVETTSLEIRYPNLTPGKYTFELYATDNNAGKSPIISTQINIKKPWYRTILFFILLGLSIVSVFYSFYRRRERQLLLKSQSDQRFAELELNALQSQMNPHFVFNAMGSLQNLVQNNEVEIADMYIAKFAKMMRMFLEGSKHKFVSIQEEIDIVLVYYELEKLRFQEKISLVYENTLSQLQMQQEIPANLLQPFIENAINHGIFHKKNGGTIKLQLLDKGTEIEINIIDNGIGRSKAAEYKSKRDHNHKSRAIEILNEKIVAIQKLEGISIQYEIIDLIKNDKACGTKVCLTLKNRVI